MSKGKKGKNAQIPVFIEKLIEMLEDASAITAIAWTQMQDSFVIKNIGNFTQTVLPKYFKHRNYSSFIRQLNMYGFSKIRHEQGDNVYTNENFKRGNRGLLKNIKRKISTEKQDKIVLYSPSKSVNKEIQQLKNKQKDLETVCKHLVAQNQKLITDNNNLMKKMKEQSRQKQKKMEQILLTMILSQNSNLKELGNGQATNPNLLSLTAADRSQDLDISRESIGKISDKEDNNGQNQKLLEGQQNLKNLLKLFNNVYNGGPKKKQKYGNYTIVNPKVESQEKQILPEIQMKQISQPQGEGQNSLLSINDFLNVGDDIDLNGNF